MIEPYKNTASLGVKKAIGHLNKVLKMIDEDSYCMDILQQTRAAEGLLKSVSTTILESHLNTCAGKVLVSGESEERERMVAELVKAFKAAK